MNDITSLFLEELESDYSGNLLAFFIQRYPNPRTRRKNESDLSQFFGSRYVSLEAARKITYQSVRHYQKDMQYRGLAHTTIVIRLNIVSLFFRWLVAAGVVNVDPANSLLRPFVSSRRDLKRPIELLTQDECVRLITNAENSPLTGMRDRAMVEVFLEEALRRREVHLMRVEDVKQIDGEWCIHSPVTKTGDNQFQRISEATVIDIRRMQLYYGITKGPLWRSITRNMGKQLGPAAIYETIKKLAKNAGLEKRITPHVLRHTSITIVAEAHDILKAKHHARHQSLGSTERYAHQRKWKEAAGLSTIGHYIRGGHNFFSDVSTHVEVEVEFDEKGVRLLSMERVEEAQYGENGPFFAYQDYYSDSNGSSFILDSINTVPMPFSAVTGDRRSTVKLLSQDEIDQLIHTASLHPKTGLRDRVLIRVLVECGLHTTEAACIMSNSVHQLNNKWIVDLSGIKRVGDQEFEFLSDELAQEIELLKKHYNISAGPLWRSMYKPDENTIGFDAITQRIEEIADRAGLQGIGPNDLYHTGRMRIVENSPYWRLSISRFLS